MTYAALIPVTDHVLELAPSLCDCHGPHVHPVAVALAHHHRRLELDILGVTPSPAPNPIASPIDVPAGGTTP